MKVINFYGEPSCGKSTTSAGLFFLMKHAGYKVELVTEYAKELTYEERRIALKDQIHIFGEQNHRLERLRNKVDYVITDSPLLLSIVYGELYKTTLYPSYNSLVKEVFDSYDNFNILLTRVYPYKKEGRNESECQAEIISRHVKDVLHRYNIPLMLEYGSRTAHEKIFQHMKNIGVIGVIVQ